MSKCTIPLDKSHAGTIGGIKVLGMAKVTPQALREHNQEASRAAWAHLENPQPIPTSER